MEQNRPRPTELWRIRILYGVVLVFAALYAIRLGYIQIFQHDRYQAIALKEHEKKFVIPAERGEIYMQDGEQSVPLALNETVYTVFADSRYIEDTGSTAQALASILGGDIKEYETMLQQKDSAYVVIARRVSGQKANIIKSKQLAGIGLQSGSQRVYPEGDLASQLLGFVNDEGHGQYGIEESLDSDFSGQDGLLKAITDVHGVPLPTSDDNIAQPPVTGSDITLTIDRNIQQFTEEALKKGVESSKGKSGSAIVLDPNTGAIIAMANYPTYDPNKYREIPEDQYALFQNRVATESYEAGSCVKVFTMISGLNEGVVTKDSTYYDAGSVEIDGWKIENAGGSGGKTRTMLDVISHSVNTGVVHVLSQLGGGEINEKARNTLYDYFTNKFGFGSATGVAQMNEATGTVKEPTTHEGDNIRYANMTFGQGITVTMIQMAAAYSSLVNGGTYYKPYLVHSKTVGDNKYANEPQALRTNMFSDESMKQLQEMMQEVIKSGGGYSAKRDGYIIGGKTGTAQIPDENGQYTQHREIGSFIGYGAGQKSQYVIMTRVNEPNIPGYAGTIAAAPIFADISNYLIEYYQIAPSY